MTKNIIWAACAVLFFTACSDTEKKDMKTQQGTLEVKDPHTRAKPREAKVTHLMWAAEVDFEQNIINATATWTIERKRKADSVIFDIEGLEIEKVLLDAKEKANYYVGEHDKHLGSPLVVKLEDQTESVSITYKTARDAAALQWLSPEQTAGKKYPFLFTQSQAILARTWLPCQDSPGIRFTYEAEVRVPAGLMAVMSASNPKEKSQDGLYRFEMKQPVPAYLMALAAGDLEFGKLGEITGVYAEPSMLKKSLYEFANMDSMLVAAEDLYGKYRWGQYDVLVLPPSFPFGGMENPRLTFATPTILAGDRSLTSLIAHELAHSWSGNLVTNESWNDFWLNEGFTVYFERRIMESLYGESYAEMLNVLGMQDLQNDLSSLKPEDTQLKLDLKGRNPDDGMNNVAYEKGNFFLKTIEDLYGREAFDQFVSAYFDTFAFQTVNTDAFLEYLDSNLLKTDTVKRKKLRVDEWVFSPGLPDNCVKVKSRRLQRVQSSLKAWEDGVLEIDELKTDDWSTHEWLYFLRQLSSDLSVEKLTELDRKFGFTRSGNSEILAAWFIHTIRADYEPAYAKLEEFLTTVGRRKFLVPLYGALTKTEAGKERARKIYQIARPNYHSVSRNTIDDMLN